MSQTLLDYVFSAPHIANSDGSYGFDVPAAAIIASGMTAPVIVGDKIYDKAMDLGSSLSAKVNLSTLQLSNPYRFHIRVVFRMETAFTGTQVMLESDRLPFGIILIGQSGAVHLSVALTSSTNGSRTTQTFNTPIVTPGAWHIADLVYDVDTLAAFLDGQVYSLHGFGTQNGINISTAAGASLLIGVGSVANSHFNGKLAALTFENTVPADLGTSLDLRRTSPQWYITTKVDNLKPKLDMGVPTSPIAYNTATSSWTQEYSIGGAIMYNSAAMAAFEIHGAIYQRYKAMPNPDSLGFLISDESPSSNAVGRKNVFSLGAIYWSSSTGAYEVVGQMYLDYEDTGESAAWGFPIEPPQAVAGGSSQRMQNATWYLRTGAAKAHEVQGLILTAFQASGGLGTWGFPVSNEFAVTVTEGPQKGKNVRSSEFEGCTFYWSGDTGAHETHGEIRKQWLALGGPQSAMGLPNTDELPVPGSSNRISGFQGGVIGWYGAIKVITPFHLRIGTLNTKRKEGPLAGGNDLYFSVTIIEGSEVVLNQRYPPTGFWSDQDVHQVNQAFPLLLTPTPNKPITFRIDVSDDDSPFTPDHLGTWVKTLDSTNAWGFLENHLGLLNSGSFNLINNIDVAVAIDVDPKSLTLEQKWWGFKNQRTDPLTFNQYEEAFSDVGTTTEVLIPADDVRAVFFELGVKHIAKDGNCFGMCLEAIYSLKGNSNYVLPLDRFLLPDWELVRNKINVKHAYQLGAPAMWWAISQFVSGQSHDPLYVFNHTRDAFFRGDNPVLCLTQNSDFSGNPHVIMPVGWHSDNPTSFKIDIMDPNFPNTVKTLLIDSTKNTFSYAGLQNYSGTSSSGGRLHYMPWSILSTQPRTPAWEAILLLIAGIIIIFGDGATSVDLRDAQGNDIQGHGQRAADLAKTGAQLHGFFTPVPLANGSVPGGFLATTGVPPISPSILSPRQGFSAADNIINKTPGLDTTQPLTILPDFEALLRQISTGDFVHTLRGTTNGGTLHYFTKKAFVHLEVTGSIDAGEDVIVTATAVETSNASFSVQVNRSKKISLQVSHLIGTSQEFVTVRLDLETDKAGRINFIPKPSLSMVDLELVGAKLKSMAQITVSALTNGKTATQISHLDPSRLDTGACRLKIHQMMLGSAGIVVGRLVNVRSQALDSVILEPDLELAKAPIKPMIAQRIPG